MDPFLSNFNEKIKKVVEDQPEDYVASREDIAYQVCEHSIKRRDPSAEVIPLKQKQMRDQGLYTRPVDKLASTEFTFTRFFVPYMNDFKGWAVFCDCDFL